MRQTLQNNDILKIKKQQKEIQKLRKYLRTQSASMLIVQEKDETKTVTINYNWYKFIY